MISFVNTIWLFQFIFIPCYGPERDIGQGEVVPLAQLLKTWPYPFPSPLYAPAFSHPPSLFHSIASVPLHRKDDFDCKICFLTRKVSSLPSTHCAGRSVLRVNHHQIKLPRPLPDIPWPIARYYFSFQPMFFPRGMVKIEKFYFWDKYSCVVILRDWNWYLFHY